MKRIIVILIFALLLIPGVNAQELDDRQTETTTKYGSESVFLNYGYVLNPNDSVAFDLYPLSYLHLAFSINVDETVRVTATRLSKIMITCPLVLEMPDGNISDRSSYVALCASDGSTIFDSYMKNDCSYSYSNYDIRIEDSLILYVANHENVSLVTLLNLEFTYSFTYEITRYVEPEISIQAVQSLVVGIVIGTFLFGVIAGYWGRIQYEKSE